MVAGSFEAIALSTIAWNAKSLKIIQCVRAAATNGNDMDDFERNASCLAEATHVAVALQDEETLADWERSPDLTGCS